ncbi:hypothetical protein TELCIR_03551 [Teladorsagia circumcincta]|uniref:Uncharacterized protein n=1 Tax=Teladorsagia circumcincta TaxID=45464 RepID=A0A2G9UW32_TELCI|nr:hypothetical protein TELCIR_03551 [Teladorsagia circumcincta]
MRSKYTTQLIPMLRGGGQEQKLRSGHFYFLTERFGIRTALSSEVHGQFFG